MQWMDNGQNCICVSFIFLLISMWRFLVFEVRWNSCWQECCGCKKKQTSSKTRLLSKELRTTLSVSCREFVLVPACANVFTKRIYSTLRLSLHLTFDKLGSTFLVPKCRSIWVISLIHLNKSNCFRGSHANPYSFLTELRPLYLKYAWWTEINSSQWGNRGFDKN